MSEQSILDALDGQLNGNLSTIPYVASKDVTYIGSTYVPEAETPYISVQCTLSGRMITAGQRGVYEWRGIYRVSCNVPLGRGRLECQQMRDAVRALYSNGSSLATSDGLTVRFFAPSVPALIEANQWLTGVVNCPWFCHEMQG